MPLSIQEFVRRWKLYTGDRSYPRHQFLDIRTLLSQPMPAQQHFVGERYAFE